LHQLHFAKNKDDDFHCPILFKPFNEYTHIVCVATTGNVFCYEALDELNIKPKIWKVGWFEE
jgi:peptidyl-prolyl cis-trans isomerase-like 2